MSPRIARSDAEVTTRYENRSGLAKERSDLFRDACKLTSIQTNAALDCPPARWALEHDVKSHVAETIHRGLEP